MTTKRELTVYDAASILRGVGAVEGVVLIGGQALNFWAERYRSKDPMLAAHGPFTTHDVDFLAGKAEAQHCAERLGVSLRVPGMDEHTPNTGLLVVGNDTDAPITIDFMGDVLGVDATDVEASAVEVDIEGASLRVMHPLLCLESRLANCFGVLHREDSHSIGQLRVAIRVVRCYLAELLTAGDERRALKITEKIGRTAVRDPAKEAFRRHDVDVLDAIPVDAFKATQFRDVRWPQLVAAVASKRKEYARLFASRAHASKPGRTDSSP